MYTLSKMPKNNYGFGMVETVIVIAILAIVGIVGWTVLKPQQASKNGPSKTSSVTIKQGVAGAILLRSGNCQPPISSEAEARCSGEPYNTPTDVIIRKPSGASSKAEVVKKVSGAKGSFQVELPVGSYSLFVMHNGQESCNFYDGQGQACVFDVQPQKVTTYNVTINEAAD
jgi:type II secretory pathway pseudopilin PulG